MNKGRKIFGTIGCTAGFIASAVLYFETGYDWLMLIAGCTAMGAVVCGILLALSQKKAASVSAYRRKDVYISRAEWQFLQLLRNLLGEKYEVCVQAPLVAVIDKPGASFRNELFRVVDYLVVDPDSYAPLLLIELNDASHKRADRKERDRKVAEICASAKMPLLTFTVQQSYDPVEVRKLLMKALRS